MTCLVRILLIVFIAAIVINGKKVKLGKLHKKTIGLTLDADSSSKIHKVKQRAKDAIKAIYQEAHLKAVELRKNEIKGAERGSVEDNRGKADEEALKKKIEDIEKKMKEIKEEIEKAPKDKLDEELKKSLTSKTGEIDKIIGSKKAEAATQDPKKIDEALKKSISEKLDEVKKILDPGTNSSGPAPEASKPDNEPAKEMSSEDGKVKFKLVGQGLCSPPLKEVVADAKTPKDCLAKCAEKGEKDCRSFSFDSKDPKDKCVVYKEVDTVKVDDKKDGAVCYVRTTEPETKPNTTDSSAPSPEKPKETSGPEPKKILSSQNDEVKFKLVGKGLCNVPSNAKSANIEKDTDCVEKCAANAECGAFSFDAAAKECTQHKVEGKAKVKVETPKDGTVCYERKKDVPDDKKPDPAGGKKGAEKTAENAPVPAKMPGEADEGAKARGIHNAFRADHLGGATEIQLVFNKKLKEGAKAWAEKLAADAKKTGTNIRHDKEGQGKEKFGENLFWTKEKLDNAEAVVKASVSWYKEVCNYNFENGYTKKPGAPISHFTQMVWKDSKQMGIGIVRKKDIGTFVVARYLPAGNVQSKNREKHKSNVLIGDFEKKRDEVCAKDPAASRELEYEGDFEVDEENKNDDDENDDDTTSLPSTRSSLTKTDTNNDVDFDTEDEAEETAVLRTNIAASKIQNKP